MEAHPAQPHTEQDVAHGTLYAYSKHKCRCAPCRSTWNSNCHRYRQQRILYGRCPQCGVECSASSQLCAFCAQKHRESERRSAIRKASRQTGAPIHPGPGFK